MAHQSMTGNRENQYLHEGALCLSTTSIFNQFQKDVYLQISTISLAVLAHTMEQTLKKQGRLLTMKIGNYAYIFLLSIGDHIFARLLEMIAIN